MTDIALTGATGFIGRALLPALRSHGYQVRALMRNPSKAAGSDIEIVQGDLADTHALERLVSEASHVIHLAGAVRGRNRSDFDRVNVDGTRTLMRALRDRPTPLLAVSSLAAREPGLSWYASSKAHAEDLIREREALRPTMILRPPAVYGPGDREMLPVFRFMRRSGMAPVAGSADARLSLIFVEDLVAAILNFVQSSAPPSGVFSLHDGRVGGYNWHELSDTVGAACGRTVRPRSIPPALLGTVANLNLATAWLTGRSPMLTPSKLRELRHRDWVCDNDAISNALQWTPRVRLAEGLLRTPGWRH